MSQREKGRYKNNKKFKKIKLIFCICFLLIKRLINKIKKLKFKIILNKAPDMI